MENEDIFGQITLRSNHCLEIIKFEPDNFKQSVLKNKICMTHHIKYYGEHPTTEKYSK